MSSKSKVAKEIRDVRFDLARAIHCVEYFNKEDWATLETAELYLMRAKSKIDYVQKSLKELQKISKVGA